MYKMGDYVRITKDGYSTGSGHGLGSGHGFSVGSVVQITSITKKKDGYTHYKAINPASEESWLIDEDCSTFVATPLKKGEKAKIIKDGKEALDCGSAHGFKVGDVVVIKSVDGYGDYGCKYKAVDINSPYDAYYYVNDTCIEPTLTKITAQFAQYSIKIVLPGQNRGYNVKLGADGKHTCTCKSFKAYGKCRHIPFAIEKYGCEVGLHDFKNEESIKTTKPYPETAEPELSPLEVIQANAKWRLR